MDNSTKFFLLWLYAPMSVAIILFLVFPKSTAEVSGGTEKGTKSTGLHGIWDFLGINKWKITGAFAGYFLLLFLSKQFITDLLPNEEYEVWTIEGEIRDREGGLLRDSFFPVIKIVPPQKVENGRFTMKVIGEKGHKDAIQFNDFIIEAQTYNPVNLPSLDYRKEQKNIPDPWVSDYEINSAKLKDPIKMDLDLTPGN
jgi:hypothetical protein